MRMARHKRRAQRQERKALLAVHLSLDAHAPERRNEQVRVARARFGGAVRLDEVVDERLAVPREGIQLPFGARGTNKDVVRAGRVV